MTPEVVPLENGQNKSTNGKRKRSWGAVVSLLVLAFVLRSHHLEKVAVEHFDEGVYASNLYSEHLDFRFPDQHLYAPPLLPTVFEWMLISEDGAPDAVMWVNVFLGTALVFAVWWTTRMIGGDRSAIVAATLVTFSDYFVNYSRAALTDIPVCLWMVLAIGAILKGLDSGSRLWMIIGAALTALAWWTKYNGWLPLAISGAGLAGWVVFERPEWRHARAILFQWMVIAALAVLMWTPVLSSLQPTGGYRAVAENHAGYVTGVSGWVPSMIRHVQVAHHDMGLLTVLGIIAGSVSLGFGVGRTGWWWVPLSIVVCGGVLYIAGPIPVLFVGAVIGFVIQFRVTGENEFVRWGFWFLLAWFVSMSLMTPMYRPYPRLMMPWVLSAVIGMSLLASNLKSKNSQRLFCLTWRIGSSLPWIMVIICLYVGDGVPSQFQLPSQRTDRTAFRTLAVEYVDEFAQHTDESLTRNMPVDAVVYVLAEPGLYYHLASLDDGPLPFIAQPASNLGMLAPGQTDPRVPTFLITGPHSKTEAKELLTMQNRVEMLRVDEVPMSDLVLLDDMAPSELEAAREQTVTLWKLKRFGEK